MSSTPEFSGREKSIEGTSTSGKKSLKIIPCPKSSISQFTEVPSPVPYTFLFLYCNSKDCSSASNIWNSETPVYSCNTKLLSSVEITILGWNIHFSERDFDSSSLTSITVTEYKLSDIFLRKAVSFALVSSSSLFASM